MSTLDNVLNLKTLASDVRFAERIVKSCKSIGKQNGIDLFAVPLIKSKESSTFAQRFSFGETDCKEQMQHKTILIVGEIGSGKTTLIDCMINYIFDVQREDKFRFQLSQQQLDEWSETKNQTSCITAYDIHHEEGFRIPYSLTIVDTPGYGNTEDISRDQEITEMIRKFFEDKDGMQELDMIGFVVPAPLGRLTVIQRYIFDSVFSIFGNDVKENINFLLTFADSQLPPVLNAITKFSLFYPTNTDTTYPVFHKFNKSSFFSNRVKYDVLFWGTVLENFKNFFDVLAKMNAKSLTSTKQVLNEKKQLQVTVEGLQPLVEITRAKMEELRIIKMLISSRMFGNEKQATNIFHDIKTSDIIKLMYELELEKKLTAKELLETLEKDIEDNKKIMLERVDTVSRCLKRLDEIALHPNPSSIADYFDLIISNEQQERPDYMERIEILKKLHQHTVIIMKVKNNESLYS